MQIMQLKAKRIKSNTGGWEISAKFDDGSIIKKVLPHKSSNMALKAFIDQIGGTK